MSERRLDPHQESELLDLLFADPDRDGLKATIIPRRSGDAPLSFGQLRLWSLHQNDPASPAYHIGEAVQIHGPLDVEVLRRTMAEIVRRHEALRTVVVRAAAAGGHDGIPVARVLDEPDSAELFRFEDLSYLPAAGEMVAQRLPGDSARAFDLAQWPLVRLNLYKTGPLEHVALLSLHHIVADGWSMGVLLREVAEIYPAFARQAPSPLPELPIQYGDFSAWQHARSGELERQVQYWVLKLGGLHDLSLPLDRPRPNRQTFEGAVVPVRIPAALAARLADLARAHQATPFMLLLAAFQALLHRYSGSVSVPVGTPVANRDRQELEPLIGFFVNMLVMRGDLSGRPSFAGLLRRTRADALEAYANQEAPFEQVVHALGGPRRGDRNPVFQVSFALDRPPAGPLAFAGLTVSPLATGTPVAKFDLSLSLTAMEGGFAGGFEYNTALLEPATVERMARHFLRLLDQIAAAPDAPVALLDILTVEEREQYQRFNQTHKPYPDSGLADLFEATVEAYPDHAAVEYGALRWTYRELNRRANRLAWHLRQRGVCLEALVGISVAEPLDALVPMLAVIKAGGAYVPLVPSDPRRPLLAAQCGLRWVIASPGVEALEGTDTIPTGAGEGLCEDNLPYPAGPANLAYAIYTSGSTGQPKCIAIPQQAVVRLVRNTDYLRLSAGDRVGQASTYAFDAITFEVWGAWLNGACVVGIPRDVSLSPRRLAAHLRDRRITAMFLTTSLFNGVVAEEPSAFASLDTLLVGGEAQTARHIARMLEHGAPRVFVNIYGPTESTTFATWHAVRQIEGDRCPPIGLPIANTTAHVLDRNLQPLPAGIAGELYLGGDGLARGYLGQPALTAGRFLPDPFSSRPGARLYRTGDIVKRQPGGAIEFIGRADHQVKLRGYRIELGEIEAALTAVAGVHGAAVVLRDGQRLSAHVAARPEVTASRLRQYLEERLPSFLIPSSITVERQLPLNANGKIDRQALVEPREQRTAEPAGGPQTAAELAIAAVWEQTLGRGLIQADSSFWELGGDSILAIAVVGKLQRLGWKVEIRDLLDWPRACDLARRMERAVEITPAAPAPADGLVPLTPVQRWFFAEHGGPVGHFNQAVLLHSGTRLDAAELQRALDGLARRHAMLRARFHFAPGTITQEIPAGVEPVAFASYDLRQSPDPRAGLERIADRTHATLDPGAGLIFRAAHFQMPEGDRVLLVVHHLAIDRVSWSILMEDLSRALDGLAPLTPSAPFRAWAEALERYSIAPELLAQAGHWSGPPIGERAAPVAANRRPGAAAGPSQTTDFRPESTTAPVGEDNRCLGVAPERIAPADQWSGPSQTADFMMESTAAPVGEDNRRLGVAPERLAQADQWSGPSQTADFRPESTAAPVGEDNRRLGVAPELLAQGGHWSGQQIEERAAPVGEDNRRLGAAPERLAQAAHRNGPSQTTVPRPRGRFGDVRSESMTLTVEETAALLGEANRPFRTTANELLLTAFGRALGVPQTWLTIESHGREPLQEPLDVSRTVGWFTSLYPFLLDVTPRALADQVKGVKETLRAVPGKGIGYGVLRYLTPEHLRPPLSAPRPSISWNYLGQFGGSASSRFRFASESSGIPVSPALERVHEIDVVILAIEGRLEATLYYDPQLHATARIERLAAQFRAQLLELISYCRACPAVEATPADFSVPCLALAEYQKLLRSRNWDQASVEDLYPLSPLQAGLLFETLAEPDRQAYFVQVSYPLRGEFDAARFESAWARLAARHTILRTAFLHEGLDKPLQAVLGTRPVPVTMADLSAHPAPEAEVRAIEARDRARGFHLERDPLMRITVVRLPGGAHRVIWSYHHLLLDGWCLGILYSELLWLYREKEAPLPAAAPYSHYIRWLRGFDERAAGRYWTAYLESYRGLCGVPQDSTGGAPEYAELCFQFDATLTAALKDLARRLDVTLNAVVQSIWGILLARYNGTGDVVFGTIAAGRPANLMGADRMVGLFINAVPMRVRVSGGMRFADVAKAAHRDSLEREPYQSLPLHDVMAAHGGPLFDHLLTFENFPLAAESGDGMEFAVEEAPRIHDRTHYAFSLTVAPGDTLDFRIGYDRARYPAAMVERIAAHWLRLAASVVESPEALAGGYEFLPPEERRMLLQDFQSPAAPLDGTPVPVWFRRIARERPEAPALVFQGEATSYGALGEASDRVAAYLLSRGCRRGDRIAILLDRGPRLVAAVLGVLKAGCAFVPVEPGTPHARVRFLLEDCGARAILTDSAEDYGVEAMPPQGFEPASANLALPDPTGGDTAYVIYTSGSTGLPKGCPISHANLAHYLHWASAYYFDGASGGNFPLFTSLAFDLTVTSLFLPLLRGKTVYLYPQEAAADEVLADVLRAGSPIDSVKLTPAHLALIEHLDLPDSAARNLGVLIAGGEALPLKSVRYCHSLNRQLAIFNEYGPTETTVGCIVSRVEPSARRVLIGRPISNTPVYILDARLRLCPIGVAGEIAIGGPGVSEGYLNRPELTRERFIPDPFQAGGSLYRTGDLGRWLSSGEIEYLGRRDDQLKIRGYRVEPGEIEQHLRSMPGVDEAVVLADPAASRLVAFFTGRADAASLAAPLRPHLPEYMIPSEFRHVHAMPLTPNGKIDKAALARTEPLPAGGPAIRDAIETTLARIWEEVLGVSAIPAGANFFELGGHSLKAMQASFRIRQSFDVRLTLRDFLREPTIEGLARLVRVAGHSPAAWEPIPRAPAQSDYPLSWAQSRLWLVHRLGGAEVAYNMPRALLLEGDIDRECLRAAFDRIVDRHETLRTAFVEVDGEPRQRILRAVPFELAFTDLSGGSEVEVTARGIADGVANAPFDLASPPLLRAHLIRLAPARHVLALVIHHIAGDGWSMNLFYRELMALYEAARRGRPDPLRPLPIQYKDFACWQIVQPVREHERYWLDQWDGASGHVRLPFDSEAPEERDFAGAVTATVLPPALTEALERLAQARSTTLAGLGLAVAAWWLYDWTRQDDFGIGVSVAGRDRPETENLQGFFVNVLPLRFRLSRDQAFEELLDQVSAGFTQALEHQHYPFERLVQLLNPQRAANRQPLVNVIYSFQNFSDMRLDVSHEEAAGAGAVRIGDFGVAFPESKFDLTCFLLREPEGLRITLEYDSRLFRAQTMERGLNKLRRIFEMVGPCG